VGRNLARVSRSKPGALVVLTALLIAIAATPSPAATPRTATLSGSCLGLSPLAGLTTQSTAGRLPAEAIEEGIVEPNVASAYRRELAEPAPDAMRRARATGPVRVPVYIHVIQPDASTGVVPQATIDAQMDVLNDSFAGTTGGDDSDFEFELINSEVTINPAWYPIENGSPEEMAMKSTLRQGGSRTLNIYVGELTGGLLGWATFPSSYDPSSKQDGVVILNTSMPGNPPPYGEGDTATHEVGHWLGLFHTFQGPLNTGLDGCLEPGDMVDDTPFEASPASGCPVGLDTCPAQAGADPIENFMDYSDDACMHEFTPGQGDRMHEQTALFRNSLPSVTGRSVRTATGAPVAVTPAATDPDEDPLTYSVARAPRDGAVTGAGPELTYRPKAAFRGTDSFTVRVADVFGASDQATVTVRVGGGVSLRAKAKKKQKLSKLAIRGGCRGEACEVSVATKVFVTRRGEKTKRFPLDDATARAAAGKTEKIRLATSASQRRKITRLLGRGWRANAAAKIVATDDEGNSASRVARIRLKP
jgi:hypothetical protein